MQAAARARQASEDDRAAFLDAARRRSAGRDEVRALLASHGAAVVGELNKRGAVLLAAGSVSTADGSNAPPLPLGQLREIFAAAPGLRDLVAALRDDDLLNDGARLAREAFEARKRHRAATSSLFSNPFFPTPQSAWGASTDGAAAFASGAERLRAKADEPSDEDEEKALRALEDQVAAFRSSLGESSLAAARALEASAAALGSFSPFVAAAGDADSGDAVLAKALSLEVRLADAAQRLDVAAGIRVDDGDRRARATATLRAARGSARRAGRSMLRGDPKVVDVAFGGALKALKRTLDATPSLGDVDAAVANSANPAFPQERVASCATRVQKLVARLLGPDAEPGALHDVALALAELDDADAEDACLAAGGRRGAAAVALQRLDALRDAALGLSALYDEAEIADDTGARCLAVAKTCDGAKRVLRDAARLFAATVLSKADRSRDGARHWRDLAIRALETSSGDDGDAWRACVAVVESEAPDDATLLRALDAFFDPVVSGLRDVDGEAAARGALRCKRSAALGLLRARERALVDGDLEAAEEAAAAALGAAARASCAPLEAAVRRSFEGAGRRFQAMTHQGVKCDAAVKLSALAAATQLDAFLEQLESGDARNRAAGAARRRRDAYDAAVDAFASRHCRSLVHATFEARAAATRDDATLDAVARRAAAAAERLDGAAAALAAAAESLETSTRSLRSAAPLGPAPVVGALEARVQAPPPSDDDAGAPARLAWLRRAQARTRAYRAAVDWLEDAKKAVTGALDLDADAAVADEGDDGRSEAAGKRVEAARDAEDKATRAWADATDSWEACDARLKALRDAEKRTALRKESLVAAAKKAAAARRRVATSSPGQGSVAAAPAPSVAVPGSSPHAPPPLRVAAHPVWRELRARSRELASLLVDDDAGAVEARVLEARFYELERADVKVVEAFSRDECAKVAVALDDLGAFADGAAATKTTQPYYKQRVDDATKKFALAVRDADAREADFAPDRAGQRSFRDGDVRPDFLRLLASDLRADDRPAGYVRVLAARLLRLAARARRTALDALRVDADDPVRLDARDDLDDLTGVSYGDLDLPGLAAPPRRPPERRPAPAPEGHAKPKAPPQKTKAEAADIALESARGKIAAFARDGDAEIARLVDVATDPAVLCHMYEGWAPWV